MALKKATHTVTLEILCDEINNIGVSTKHITISVYETRGYYVCSGGGVYGKKYNKKNGKLLKMSIGERILIDTLKNIEE